MAKISFQDVVPPNKRSIRNVSINSARRSRVQPESIQREEPKIIELNKVDKATAPKIDPIIIEHEQTSPKFSEGINHYTPSPINTTPISSIKPQKDKNFYFEENGKRKPGKKTLVFVLMAIVLVGFAAFIMTIMSSATVTIIPKRASVETNLELKSTKDGSVGTKHELIKLTKSSSASVPAKGEEMVEKKASGKIMVYNNFSEEPQRLISRTRFETPEGLIYRIPESIVIPGKRVVDGKDLPGSLEVEVFADEAGEKYNIGKADFTIPGFKTDKTRYTNFYAKSVTEMAGGFIGKMRTVVESDKTTALTKLESEIKTNIEKEIHSQVPDGLVLLNGGIFYTKKELPQKDEGSSVSLTLELTAHALLLPLETLSNEITNNTVGSDSNWEGIESKVSDFSPLSISTNTENPVNAGVVDIKISGSAPIESVIDTNVIIGRLVGTKQKDMSTILGNFPGIVEAKAAIRPIWKKTFPENSAKIYINIQ